MKDVGIMGRAMQLRGFGVTMNLERGTMRSWFVGDDGVKRWADNGAPVIPAPDDARTDRPHK